MGTLLSFESVPKAKNLTKKNTTTKLSELAFKMDDPRLEWLSCVLKSSINVPKKAFLKHLNTDRNEDAIDDFFNARIKKNPDNELEDTGHIFFWATKRKITKSKTIKYEEEVTDDEQPEEDERPITTENNPDAAAGDSNTSVKS